MTQMDGKRMLVTQTLGRCEIKYGNLDLKHNYTPKKHKTVWISLLENPEYWK